MKKVIFLLAFVLSLGSIGFITTAPKMCRDIVEVIPLPIIKVDFVKTTDTINVKWTTYTTIVTRGYRSPKDGYGWEVTLGGLPCFIKDTDHDRLKVEGFAKVIVEDSDKVDRSYVLDYKGNLNQYPRNAMNKPLKEGQIACNWIELGTKVKLNNEDYTVTDIGSGLGDKDDRHVDVFVYDYREKTGRGKLIVNRKFLK